MPYGDNTYNVQGAVIQRYSHTQYRTREDEKSTKNALDKHNRRGARHAVARWAIKTEHEDQIPLLLEMLGL